jgi:hypothetical protein
MSGRIINGIKYIGLIDSNDLKKQSIEHNIYFTLRDIFWNGEEHDCYMSNHLNGLLLVNQNSYSFGLNKLTYSFARKLYNYLNNFNENRIYFTDKEMEENTDSEYILFDDWWENFQALVQNLNEFIIKHEQIEK